jgi:hypothetical protein
MAIAGQIERQLPAILAAGLCTPRQRSPPVRARTTVGPSPPLDLGVYAPAEAGAGGQTFVPSLSSGWRLLLVEFLRLSDRGVEEALLPEHARGVAEWRGLRRKP